MSTYPKKPRKDIKNRVGQRYRKLVVLEWAGSDNFGNSLWKCQCDCGKTTIANSRKLVQGRKRSCGCLVFKQTYDKEFILARIKVDQATGCWNWTGATEKPGYGRISDASCFRGAHRLAYNLWIGNPGSLFVCHRCDNPPCCNPDHLFLGTCKDNTQDAINKGRMRILKGEEQVNSKLTNGDVQEIRTSSAGPLALAARFGVATSTIVSVRARKTWRHVP